MHILLLFLFLIGSTSLASASDAKYVGVVSLLENVVATGTGINGNDSLLRQGDRIFADQKITTFMNSRAQIIFLDQSVINIGPSSELSIKLFEPAKKDSSFLAEIKSGIVRFKSGALPIGSYTVTSPSTRVKLKGTEVDFLVTKGGSTEVLLRSGAASVSAKTNLSVPTQPDVNTLTTPVLLADRGSFVQLAGLREVPTAPKSASLSKREFYKNEFEISIGDNNDVTKLDRNRIAAELKLASLGTGTVVTKSQIDSEFFRRSLDRSSILTTFINTKIRTCQGNNCRILLNQQRLVKNSIRRIRRQSAAFLKNFNGINSRPDRLSQIRELLAQAVIDAKNSKEIAGNAKSAYKEAKKDFNDRKKEAKIVKQEVKFNEKKRKKIKAKNKLDRAEKKFEAGEVTEEFLLAAKDHYKNSAKDFNDAKKAVKPSDKVKKEAKKLRTAAKKENQAAKKASNSAADKVKKLQDELAASKLRKKLRKAKRKLRAANKQITNFKKSDTSEGTELSTAETTPGKRRPNTKSRSSPNSLAVRKVAPVNAKAAAKKAKGAANKAAKQAKAATKKAKGAAKKAAKQAKAARKAAARARKAALKRARQEAANN